MWIDHLSDFEKKIFLCFLSDYYVNIQSTNHFLTGAAYFVIKGKNQSRACFCDIPVESSKFAGYESSKLAGELQQNTLYLPVQLV